MPAALDSGPNHEWIHFTDVSGGVDPAGFRHLLYTGQPTGGDGIGCPSVWRVDTAADGRVIWAEMVWIFGTPDPVEPADVARDITTASLLSELAALDPRPPVARLGARSTFCPRLDWIKRKLHAESASPVRGELRGELAAVLLDDLAADVEPEAQARPRVATVGLIEAIE